MSDSEKHKLKELFSCQDKKSSGTGRKNLEALVQERTQKLRERVKELSCLYTLSELVSTPHISMEAILAGLINRIPSAWRHSEIACARILLDGQEYLTSNFRNTVWKQHADIVVENTIRGNLEVYYLEQKPIQDEGPFSKEERKLLDALAERLGRIVERIRAHAEIQRLREQIEADNVYMREEIKLEHNFDEIVGQSRTLKDTLHKIEQVAPMDSTVLIIGETGTGKELVARAIHNASPRANRPLVKVNCATLPASLIESELFGHERGAFSGALTRRQGRFELADGGTLFLDEIAELPLNLQSKLLRVLQEGEFERVGNSHTLHVNVRIIAATNRNLEELIHKNRFRGDLWYRLNVFPIMVPSLRERSDDIPLLLQFFLERICKKTGHHIQRVAPETISALMEYTWPGNIRELQNVIERAVILSPNGTLRLKEKLGNGHSAGAHCMHKTLQEMETELILRTLGETSWRIEGTQGAAQKLGLNPSTLRGRMRKYRITKPWQASENRTFGAIQSDLQLADN